MRVRDGKGPRDGCVARLQVHEAQRQRGARRCDIQVNKIAFQDDLQAATALSDSAGFNTRGWAASHSAGVWGPNKPLHVKGPAGAAAAGEAGLQAPRHLQDSMGQASLKDAAVIYQGHQHYCGG